MDNETTDRVVYWLSPLGDEDDFGQPYGTAPGSVMYDAKTRLGPRANMTEASFQVFGFGVLGTGVGQRYVKQLDGRWLKVGG